MSALPGDRNTQKDEDPVNHPKHYKSHPSGIEIIQITEHMNFCLGNVVKYIMRCEHKGKMLEDLRKAKWYLDREIARVEDKIFKTPFGKGKEGHE